MRVGERRSIAVAAFELPAACRRAPPNSPSAVAASKIRFSKSGVALVPRVHRLVPGSHLFIRRSRRLRILALPAAFLEFAHRFGVALDVRLAANRVDRFLQS